MFLKSKYLIFDSYFLQNYFTGDTISSYVFTGRKGGKEAEQKEKSDKMEASRMLARVNFMGAQ